MKIAALDIGGTAIKHCLYDDRFAFAQSTVGETPTQASLGGQAVLQKAEAILARMGSFDAIAVSTAGQIDTGRGTVVYASDNIPHYTGMPIRGILEQRFGVPAAVENDVNAAALGEAAAGAGRGLDSFLCLTYGTGIGGAVFLGGEVYHGSSFSAGEMGHIITHAGGLPCTCGGCGCYECYASTTALTRMVKERTGLRLNGREIFQKLGDERVLQAVEAWIREIMWGLVSLIHVFNPPTVILGGGIMREKFICGYLREHIGSLLMPSYRGVEIRQAELGNLAGLRGAAALAEQLVKKEGAGQ